jgi:hypothetical protein
LTANIPKLSTPEVGQIVKLAQGTKTPRHTGHISKCNADKQLDDPDHAKKEGSETLVNRASETSEHEHQLKEVHCSQNNESQTVFVMHVPHLASRAVLVFPVRYEIYPQYLLSTMLTSSLHRERDVRHTPVVPKMAPDAPSEGAPTKAKLPPSTFLGMMHLELTDRAQMFANDTHPNIPAAK